jgi:hypothetical protein
MAGETITATFIRQYTLTVTPRNEIGGAAPVVISDRGNIRCYADKNHSGCSDVYDAGEVVRLSPQPTPGWAIFGGWSGVCTGTGVCAVTITGDIDVTANYSQLGNLAFATSVITHGALGGLSGADNFCQGLADRSILPPGSYRAWLGTTGASTQDRIDSVTGWVRPDGLPVAYDARDLTMGRIRHPISLDENGNPVGTPVTAWTGTNADTSPHGDNCTNWTSSTATRLGVIGHLQHGGGEWTALNTGVGCDQQRRLICFGVSTSYPPRTPLPVAGAGYVFVSSATFNGGAGVSTMDTACRNEATTRGFTNASSYVAFVSTPTASAASRVSFTGPFHRPDGWMIGTRDQLLLATQRLHTSPTLRADESAYAVSPGWMPVTVWTGHVGGSPNSLSTATASCSGFTVGTSSSTGAVGSPAGTDWNRWGNISSSAPCNEARPVYCVRGL